ncbi:MAG: MFS transporter [Gammaproteobacteria bacterium]|jgi:DHA1 family bicyclomycin/chloramphenicol resistance-like MFS transporter|nr:MFS transporter [Gammaproteobacteria bacterium]
MFKFITVTLLLILYGAEIDIFIPSFPELQEVFHLTPFLVQQTLSLNLIAYCVFCLLTGIWGDRFNRRTIILSSLLIFLIGSLACVFAKHYSMLLIGRVLQGIGIAAPSTLAWVVLLDDYPPNKQAGVLGTLSGIMTLAICLAPVVGCYVNLYFDWHANFAIICAISVLCLITSYIAIPSKPGNPAVSIAINAYKPLLKSGKFMTMAFGICLINAPYWMFVGMAPILYMDAMGVSLEHFGLYQGANSLLFGTVSILSPSILKRFGHQFCFHMGKWVCFVSAIIILIVGILKISNPFVVTAAVLLFSFGAVFPVNILYPMSFDFIPNSKAKASALIQAMRLIITAGMLELVSYYYHDNFLSIAIGMFTCLIVAVILLQGNGKLSDQAVNIAAT